MSRRLVMPVIAVAVIGGTFAVPASVAAQRSHLTNETPAHFVTVDSSWNYTRRDVMIPMRDGVKLHTVILIPKGARNAPILLTRTPYDATATTSYAFSAHLAPELNGYDNAQDVIVPGGYIRVVQDIRGKYGSEGEYVMNRPLVGPLNDSKVDESTDTWDAIDWLTRNIPESNGRVGELGISYDGFEPLMGLINPHPALKVSVPMNPMVDGWMGDDWFHHGAFRQQNMPYILEQEATRDNSAHWWTNAFDDWDVYMTGEGAAALGASRGMQQVGFWNRILEHPSYDRWWQLQAMDSILARQPLKVPTMLVASLWDQEDIYGAIAVYRAIEPNDVNRDMVYLTMGPWYHGQEIQDGSSLGAIKFPTNTSHDFQKNILGPFLAKYLKDSMPTQPIARVNAYVTGADHWERLDRWPSGCADGCMPTPTPLFLESRMKVGFTAPTSDGNATDSYVSDPAKPVPFRTRPAQPIGYVLPLTWEQWLVDDQRAAGSRTDVLSYQSDVLTAPVQVSGEPIADLIAATTGTDADWVVKLIDVYPPETGTNPAMGGYQLAVSMDIFRGRYRESYSDPKPIAANAPLRYRFPLPTVNHVFLPGHRIMVQIQSSWFPLYDLNPQTFVPSIFFAKPDDYRKATMTIYHEPGHESAIVLPIVRP